MKLRRVPKGYNLQGMDLPVIKLLIKPTSVIRFQGLIWTGRMDIICPLMICQGRLLQYQVSILYLGRKKTKKICLAVPKQALVEPEFAVAAEQILQIRSQ
jgi:hypothetical protein